MRYTSEGWWVVEDDDVVVDFEDNGADRMKTVAWLLGESRRREITVDELLVELLEIHGNGSAGLPDHTPRLPSARSTDLPGDAKGQMDEG